MYTPSNSALRLLALCALLACTHAGAYPGKGRLRQFNVGIGPDCNYPSLASALVAARAAPGANTITLTRSVAYTDISAYIDDPAGLTIEGGYAGCGSAVRDGVTTVDGRASTLLIIATAANVTLRDLALTGAGELAGAPDATVVHAGSGLLTLRNVELRAHQSAAGAALLIDGAGSLDMAESSVFDNHGRGIDVHGSGNVSIAQASFGINRGDALRIDGAGAVTLTNVGLIGTGAATPGLPQRGIVLHAVTTSLLEHIDVRDFPDGGVSADGTGDLVIEDAVIADNGSLGAGAEHGAGISLSGTVDASLSQCTLSGNSTDGDGGAIHVGDRAALELFDCTITDNHARNGGGIALVGDGGAVAPGLKTYGEVTLADNTASADGGGIHAQHGVLWLRGARLSIARNTAERGGGLSMRGGGGDIGVTEADALFVDNEATWGGAIAASGGAQLRVFANEYTATRAARGFTRAAAPAFLRNSGGSGGAVLAQAMDATDGDTRVLLFDAWIEGNRAVVGGAIAALAAAGASAVVCVGRAGDAESCRPYGEVPSSAGACVDEECGLLRDNGASSGGDAVMRVGAGAGVRLSGARLSAHVGAALVFASDNEVGTVGEPLTLRNCLIDSNTSTVALIHAFPVGVPALEYDAGDVRLHGCTLAGNTIGGDWIARTTTGLQLRESILHQPGKRIHAGSAAQIDAKFMLAHAAVDLPIRADILVGDPRFVDPASGNYRLASGSPAIDVSNLVDGPTRDRANVTRGHDDRAAPNRFGPRDLGAYERDPDGVFRDGFERQEATPARR